MRVLVVGGCGYVGCLVVPLLGRGHVLRILDPRAPRGVPGQVRGDATDYPSLATAMRGVDAVVHMALGGGDGPEPDRMAAAFGANVTSVGLCLLAAHRAGVPHVVYVSSMSVFTDPTSRALDERIPPDACDLYGLTKRLGEQVCRAGADEYGLSVNVLRLAWPTADDLWPAWGRLTPPAHPTTTTGRPVDATAATDVAAAISAALAVRDGFQVFTVSGDTLDGRWDTTKARERLGWVPTFGAGG